MPYEKPLDRSVYVHAIGVAGEFSPCPSWSHTGATTSPPPRVLTRPSVWVARTNSCSFLNHNRQCSSHCSRLGPSSTAPSIVDPIAVLSLSTYVTCQVRGERID